MRLTGQLVFGVCKAPDQRRGNCRVWFQLMLVHLVESVRCGVVIRCVIGICLSSNQVRYAFDMVIYRSKLYATLKRNYQLMPALKWLRLLMNHVPDKFEHLVRYYGYYSNRSRGARRSAEQASDAVPGLVNDDAPVDTRRKANWARLIQKVYEVIHLSALATAHPCASSHL